MIDYVSGRIAAISEGGISVDIGSLWLFFSVANPQIFKIEQKVDLHVHMHWNQENGPSFFGFSTTLERTVFLLVISCSGIGPKIGLAVLRDLGPDSFLQAIQMEDDVVLGKVNGLGPKKVEQMVVQLRRKVAKLIKSGLQVQGANKFTDWQNVSDVLVSLNYSRGEIGRVMKFLKDNYADSELPFDGLMRHALSFLAKRR